MDTLNIIINNLSDLKSQENSTTLLHYLIDLGPLLIGFAGMWFSFRQFKKSLKNSHQQLLISYKNNIKQQAIEDERREIYKKLNEFYGPLLQLREKSSLLYERFRKSYYTNDENFRTLDYLLNNHEFSRTEKVLLGEIIEIGQKCEELVQKKAGLVDERDLRYNILPKFTTHLLILRLANEGKLKGNPSDFEIHRFPRSLDENLKSQINKLQDRLNDLNNGKGDEIL